jgi:hypothetical protein
MASLAKTQRQINDVFFIIQDYRHFELSFSQTLLASLEKREMGKGYTVTNLQIHPKRRLKKPPQKP